MLERNKSWMGYWYHTESPQFRARFYIKDFTGTSQDVINYFTGAQVFYQLATPETYQLTPTEITTLLGYNTVSADSGEISLIYRKIKGA